MADDQEIIVKELIDKVHRLMIKYKDLKTNYLQQSEEHQDLIRQLSEKQIKIDTLEQQYKTAKIATNVLAPVEDKEEARNQINRIVREIDNCIALLNR